MSDITAERAAAIMINPSPLMHSNNATVVDRFMRRFGPHDSGLSVIWPEAAVREVRPMSAKWLGAVQKRITDSVAIAGTTPSVEGTCLNQAIAHSANAVFEMTSDILPSEPFIYSSRSGDLVAEFQAPYGKLTTIISQSYVIAFASMGEVAVEKHIDLEGSNSNALRMELQKITKALCTGRTNGTKVES